MDSEGIPQLRIYTPDASNYQSGKASIVPLNILVEQFIIN
jgi:hypothetical protein